MPVPCVPYWQSTPKPRRVRYDLRDGHDSPLHLAVYNGRRDLVELLLARGAAVDARNHRQDTPLHWACQFGDRVIVDRLLQAGGSVHARETQAQTPIFMAVSAGQVEIVQVPLTPTWKCVARGAGHSHPGTSTPPPAANPQRQQRQRPRLRGRRPL